MNEGWQTFESETGVFFEYPLEILSNYSDYFSDPTNFDISNGIANGIILLEIPTTALFWILSNVDSHTSPTYSMTTRSAVEGVNPKALPNDEITGEIIIAADRYSLPHIFQVLVEVAYFNNEDSIDPFILYALSCFNAEVNGTNNDHVLWCNRTVLRSNNLRRAYHIPAWSKSSTVASPVSYLKLEECIRNWHETAETFKNLLTTITVAHFQSLPRAVHIYEHSGNYHRLPDQDYCPFIFSPNQAFVRRLQAEIDKYLDLAALRLLHLDTPNDKAQYLLGIGREACWTCKSYLTKVLRDVWFVFSHSELWKLSLDRG